MLASDIYFIKLIYFSLFSRIIGDEVRHKLIKYVKMISLGRLNDNSRTFGVRPSRCNHILDYSIYIFRSSMYSPVSFIKNFQLY